MHDQNCHKTNVKIFRVLQSGDSIVVDNEEAFPKGRMRTEITASRSVRRLYTEIEAFIWSII